MLFPVQVGKKILNSKRYLVDSEDQNLLGTNNTETLLIIQNIENKQNYHRFGKIIRDTNDWLESV